MSSTEIECQTIHAQRAQRTVVHSLVCISHLQYISLEGIINTILYSNCTCVRAKNFWQFRRQRGRLIHMTYGTTLCKLLQLTKVSFSFLLFAAAVSALQYRVTHLVGYKLMLTWIWHVTPSCMGRRLLQQRPARPVSCQKC